ncbi:MAG: Gfo/Idh/MocA family protein [Spirochaetaceae bacterium]
MKPLALGVVGPGLIWDNAHRDILLSMPEHFAITAFCARSESTLAKAHRQQPTATLFQDYQELLEDERLDGVVLLTPIPLNAPMTIRALEAGKAVFVEKPFATSLAEGRDVIEASRRAALPVYVLEQAPYATIWDSINDVIHSGRIGMPATYEKLRHVYLDAGNDQTSGYGTTDWRITTRFPIGNLFDGGVHDLAVHAKLFGSPERLRSWGRRFRPEYGEYDVVSTLFRYPDGLIGYFSHSALLGGRRNFFTIRGTEGLIHATDEITTLESKWGTHEAIADGGLTPHQEMWRVLAETARTGGSAPYSLADAGRELALLESIAKSLHDAVEVHVGSGDDT